MSATLHNPYAELLIIGCAALVLLTIFGGPIFHKLAVFNKRHHILGWDNSSIYTWEDENL